MKLTQDNNTYGCNETKRILLPFFYFAFFSVLLRSLYQYFIFCFWYFVRCCVFRFSVCLHNFNWYYIQCNRTTHILSLRRQFQCVVTWMLSVCKCICMRAQCGPCVVVESRELVESVLVLGQFTLFRCVRVDVVLFFCTTTVLNLNCPVAVCFFFFTLIIIPFSSNGIQAPTLIHTRYRCVSSAIHLEVDCEWWPHDNGDIVR